MSSKKSLSWTVSGRVQGVWFRVSTQSQAEALNITGWVKNLPDGRVEVAGFGEASALKVLDEWLHQGPSAAEVTEVVCEDIPWEQHSRFAVR